MDKKTINQIIINYDKRKAVDSKPIQLLKKFKKSAKFNAYSDDQKISYKEFYDSLEEHEKKELIIFFRKNENDLTYQLFYDWFEGGKIFNNLFPLEILQNISESVSPEIRTRMSMASTSFFYQMNAPSIKNAKFKNIPNYEKPARVKKYALSSIKNISYPAMLALENDVVAIGAEDGKIALFDLRHPNYLPIAIDCFSQSIGEKLFNAIRRRENSRKPIKKLFKINNNLIAAAFDDTTVIICDLQLKKAIYTLKMQSGICVQLKPIDSSSFFVLDSAGHSSVWDVKNFKCISSDTITQAHHDRNTIFWDVKITPNETIIMGNQGGDEPFLDIIPKKNGTNGARFNFDGEFYYFEDINVIACTQSTAIKFISLIDYTMQSDLYSAEYVSFMFYSHHQALLPDGYHFATIGIKKKDYDLFLQDENIKFDIYLLTWDLKTKRCVNEILIQEFGSYESLVGKDDSHGKISIIATLDGNIMVSIDRELQIYKFPELTKQNEVQQSPKLI